MKERFIQWINVLILAVVKNLNYHQIFVPLAMKRLSSALPILVVPQTGV
ncbi:hypothetical protein KKE26_05990 [bacterium]|nr:hypothetical protein [bacterium]MBU1754405.1 hypothetical protein [bacterium]